MGSVKNNIDINTYILSHVIVNIYYINWLLKFGFVCMINKQQKWHHAFTYKSFSQVVGISQQE